LVQARLAGVDPATRIAQLENGSIVSYDTLLLATGAASVPAFESRMVFNWDDETELETLRGFLRELANGCEEHLAIVIPPGPGWPLPAYELALLIASDARGMGGRLQITLVTPEKAPLAAFGSTGSAMVAEELEHAGVRVELGACAEVDSGPPTAIILRPSVRRLDVTSVLALPRLRGRVPSGIPANADGFVTTDAHGRVVGVDHVWAAGDVADLPLKFGGLATEQADAAAADILVDAGAPIERMPFRPVLRGQLLTSGSPRYVRYSEDGGEVASHTLWWPPSKVSGRYLAPWLAERDDEAIVGRLPSSRGVPVQIDLHREVVGA
jgi:sulfide:quinone oxidoreductase